MGPLRDGKLNKEENGYLAPFSKGLRVPGILHGIPALHVTLPTTTRFHRSLLSPSASEQQS